MLRIQSYNNVPFGTKFVIGSDYVENDVQRMRKIGKKYESVTRSTPDDTFVVNTGYLEYHKAGKETPMTFPLSFKTNYIAELLKYDDKTVLEKFKLLSDIARQAFKCDEETSKYLNKMKKMTGDDTIKVINNDKRYGIGESYANKSVKKDPVLKDIVEFAVF